MANTKFINKLMSMSPYIEVLIRHIYWNNIKIFKKFMAHSITIKKQRSCTTDSNAWAKILNYLNTCGVKQGSLMIVHSAYGQLLSTKKAPEQIIKCLIDFIGQDGTLAMPAIPKFINDVGQFEYISKDISNIVFDYDVKNSDVITGVLPKILCAWKGAIRSRYPVNTMVAFGPMAGPMMKDNLKGVSPLPCGVNSSWSFCHDNNAFIVGLGVDLVHNLTMIHVAEDLLDEKWPIRNWYRNRHFTITDKDFKTQITIRERHPRWGTLHFAERTLRKDLIKENIMRTTEISGITVECIKAKELIKYLSSRNNTGYPYYAVKRYRKGSCLQEKKTSMFL